MIKNVLVLDGGGVKGIFSHNIIENLMIELDQPITETIDLIIGVSVGAMVGSLVAMDLMNSIDSKRMFIEIPKLFRQKNSLGPLMAPMYDGVGKTKTIKRILGNSVMGDCKIPIAIITCGMNGVPKIFKSWENQDVLLSEVVNASTAAPVMFPPVYIERFGWLTDGGVVSSKPLIMAITICFRFFGSLNNIQLLSIGTKATKEIKMDSSVAMDSGLLMWLSGGILDIYGGSADDTPEQLVKMLLGDTRFMRVTNNQEIDTMDHSSDAINRLKDATNDEWSHRGSDIISFLQRGK